LATANSVWTAANFLGGGLCALTIFLIAAVGWRSSLYVTGGIGLALGLFAKLVV
jgi:sugar phosphate permease